MKNESAIIGVLLLICSTVGVAGIPTSRPVDELYRRSSVVVKATITSSNGSCINEKNNVCNNNYLLSIKSIEQYKGSALSETVPSSKVLCSNSALEIGETYVLFLEQVNAFNDVSSNKCSLVIDYDGVFQKIGDDFYRVGSPDLQVIVDFEGRKYMTNAIVEPGFEDALLRLTDRTSTGREKP
ncbi:MAG: hypothetical protein HOQ32_03760 [Lysobacter sp.]|nr:hypothetical protein [Lysobacter sp.]